LSEPSVRPISATTSVTRSRFCRVCSIFLCVARLWIRYFAIPAASSMRSLRSSGLAVTITPMRPCSTIDDLGLTPADSRSSVTSRSLQETPLIR